MPSRRWGWIAFVLDVVYAALLLPAAPLQACKARNHPLSLWCCKFLNWMIQINFPEQHLWFFWRSNSRTRRCHRSSPICDIYLGVVENVLPGIDAAFVNIGDTGAMVLFMWLTWGLWNWSALLQNYWTVNPQQKVLVQVMKNRKKDLGSQRCPVAM